MVASLRYVGPKDLTDRSLATSEDVKRTGGAFRQNAAKTTTGGVMTKIQFQTTDNNTGITVITNDGFQVPTAGVYAMTFDGRITVLASIYVAIAGTSHSDQDAYFQDHADTKQDWNIGGTMPLAANDTVCCYVFAGSAVTTATSRWSRFRIYRVGN